MSEGGPALGTGGVLGTGPNHDKGGSVAMAERSVLPLKPSVKPPSSKVSFQI